MDTQVRMAPEYGQSVPAFKLNTPNIGTMIAERADRYHSKPCFAEKNNGQFEGVSWSALWKQVRQTATQLSKLGLQKGERIAILSENRGEMLIHDLAGMASGLVVVPIFSGYYPDQVAHILDHSEPSLLTVSTAAQLEKTRQWKGFSSLRRVLVMDVTDVPFDIQIRPFSEAMETPMDPAIEKIMGSLSSEIPCLMMYTSGTTGHPKGVVLCHKNILSQQEAVAQIWDVTERDTFLSYLPWHHSFGGLFERFMALFQGATMYLDESRGKNISLMLENFKLVQPTLFFSVPKVYQALMAESAHSTEIERTLFHPRLRFVFTAAAPLSDEVSNIFSRHGIPVHEGWGLTETSPDITLTRPGYRRVSGIVGWPLPGVEVKLSEEGEILAKGPNIMKEYFKAPDLTSQVLESNGWFHTGDLGEWTLSGLRIVGRVDGIFKLSNAEKVCPDKIEKVVMGRSRLVLQCLAAGSGKDDVGLLIYLNWREVQFWLAQQPLKATFDFTSEEERQKMVEYSGLIAHLTEEIFQANQVLQVKYERAKRFIVLAEELTLERGELTPTMKVVRRKVLEHFQWAVQALYEDQPGLSRRNVGIVPV